MSRANKRGRWEITCGGCGCGDPACRSCDPGDLENTEEYRPSPPSLPSPQYRGLQSPAAVAPELRYDLMISQMDNNIVRLILAGLAITSPSARAAVGSFYEQQLRSQAAAGNGRLQQDDEGDDEDDEDDEDQEEDENYDEDGDEDDEEVDDPHFELFFDRMSKTAWHTLNAGPYTHLSSSKQYEASGDAFDEVASCIKAVKSKTYANSPYEKKLSALETLQNIAKTVLLGDDTLGYEVRKQFQHESCLADAMLSIAESMTAEEQRRAGSNADAKGSLADKLRWVCREADGLCIEGLDVSNVLGLLRNKAA